MNTARKWFVYAKCKALEDPNWQGYAPRSMVT